MTWKQSHGRARTDALCARSARWRLTNGCLLHHRRRKHWILFLGGYCRRRRCPIPADQDLLIQRLMGTICPPKPVAQERSAVTELQTMLLNWLPVRTVTEEKAASPSPSTVSAEGCFSCGVLTHTTADCRILDESFLFLPTGWQAERVGDQFILGLGPPASPQGQQMGNSD